MSLSLRIRLSVMMFCTYVIWGAWLPMLGRYLTDFLGFSGAQLGWVFATMAIASVTAMFGSAQVADRWFSSERFMFVSHLVAGILMFFVAAVEQFWPFFFLMLFYAIFYLPTLSLANSISFEHMPDAQRDFGGIRVWGTIGWVAASWPLFFILQDLEGEALKMGLKWTFYLAGGASLFLAFFSLSLPHTPPKKDAAQEFAPFKALKLLKIPAFLVLFILTLSDASVHQCYFVWTSAFMATLEVPDQWIMPAMSIAQVAEVFTMAAMGWFLRKLGWRKMLSLGVLAHVIRFAIYSYAAGKPELAWLVIASNVVHGAAYTFFLAVVYVFAEEFSPKDVRASAQMLFNLVILGIGPFVSSLIWGYLGDVYKDPQTGVIDFRGLFMVPTIWALITAVILLLTFWPPKEKPAKDGEGGGAGDSGLGDGEAEVEQRLKDLGYVE